MLLSFSQSFPDIYFWWIHWVLHILKKLLIAASYNIYVYFSRNQSFTTKSYNSPYSQSVTLHNRTRPFKLLPDAVTMTVMSILVPTPALFRLLSLLETTILVSSLYHLEYSAFAHLRATNSIRADPTQHSALSSQYRVHNHVLLTIATGTRYKRSSWCLGDNIVIL